MKVTEDLFIPISVVDLPLIGEGLLYNGTKLHPLCKIAAENLQTYLQKQTQWSHNFGLSNEINGNVIGKMFGVLVVKNQADELGYLAAFSGKLAGGNLHSYFVPPVFDALTENSFLNVGMAELNSINIEIAKLENNIPENSDEIEFLKSERKDLSIALQNKLFKHYNFLNQGKVGMNLIEIFQKAGYKNPPSGAGECAAPKLLNYAFQNNLKPIALAEFWWGLSPKSNKWKHGQFYPTCKEKCEPILEHMIDGVEDLMVL